jgi:hydrogenase 3 maturation protease
VGIGSELNSDDAAGVAAVRLLRPLFARAQNVLVVEAGPVAENAAGSLRRFQPDGVILLDAAWFGGRPGEIRGLDWRAAEGFSASTHALPLSVLAQYLETELGCQVFLIGVQVERVTFDLPMTRAVAGAVRKLARGLHQVLTAEG